MPEEFVCPSGELPGSADISADPDTPPLCNPGLISCPACGATDSADLYYARDHLVSLRDFMIRRCNVCGMGWTADPPSEKDAGAYYLSEEYISHTNRKQTLSDYLYHLARGFMLGRKKRLVTAVTGKSTGVLIDIGSGTGYFPAYMKKRSWNVTGVEISEAARNYSVERFGLKAVAPHEIKNMPSGSADCITLWHVLEHLYDPAEWFREISRILKEEGKCIIALPNFSSADADWFSNGWAALDVPRHLWHFTSGSLKIFAGRNGFACESIFTLPLDLFYISILSYRNRGSRLALVKGLLTGVFLALSSRFRKDKSSSLVYVLSKKESI